MTAKHIPEILGRVLVAALFIPAGVVKIIDPTPYLDHMASFHVPAQLLPLVIAVEIGAGLAVLAGWQLKLAAGALAGFCLLTAAIFHSDFSNKAERTQFFKDLAIAGGLISVVAFDISRRRLGRVEEAR